MLTAGKSTEFKLIRVERKQSPNGVRKTNPYGDIHFKRLFDGRTHLKTQISFVHFVEILWGDIKILEIIDSNDELKSLSVNAFL